MMRSTPVERILRSQDGQGRAIPRDPSWRMRATQTIEPGVNLLQRRASAWTCEHLSGAGPLRE